MNIVILKVNLVVYLMSLFLMVKAQNKIKLKDIERTAKVSILNNFNIVEDSLFFINYFSNDILQMNKLTTNGFDEDFVFYNIKIRPLKIINEQSDTHMIYTTYFSEFKNDSFIICYAKSKNRIYLLDGFKENENKILTAEIRRYYEKSYYSFRKVKFKEFVEDFSIIGFDINLFKKYW